MTHDSDAEIEALAKGWYGSGASSLVDLAFVKHIFAAGHKAALANAVEGFVERDADIELGEIEFLPGNIGKFTGGYKPALLLIQPEPKQTKEDV